MCCTKCHPHNQKSLGVRTANIKMKTGEGCLLDGCRAWTCGLVATGIAGAQREVNRMSDWFGIMLTILSVFTGGFALGYKCGKEIGNE